ncbi:hypothetical protein D3C87_1660660 [compost metagenome]
MRLKRGLAMRVNGSRFTLPAITRSPPPRTASAMAPSGGVMAKCASPASTAAVALSTLPIRLSSTSRPWRAKMPSFCATKTGSQLNPIAPPARTKLAAAGLFELFVMRYLLNVESG